MRIFSVFLISIFCFVVLLSLNNPSPSSIGYESTVDNFKTNAHEFSASVFRLQSSISAISGKNFQSIKKVREALKDCRLSYKKLQCFIEYFFKSSAIFFNGPPKFEIEEPDMEWQTPIGLQVIESLVYEKNVGAKKSELLEQVDALYSSAKDLTSLLYEFKADDKQILESIRLELIRIYILGITGFDAPFLKSGIREAYVALGEVQHTLRPYLQKHSKYADSVTYYLNSSRGCLNAGTNFDSFDRLSFLTNYGLPLQHYVGLLIDEMHLSQNTNSLLNYDAVNLFSPDALNINAFPNAGMVSNGSLLELGRKLFFEKALSGNNKISCATCHNPAKYFTDGIAKSIAFNGHSMVQRNAPTLLYTGFQYVQFWDGRVKSIEEQVRSVLNNPTEMNGNYKASVKRLYEGEKYRLLFKEAFPSARDSVLNADQIAKAIAVFVRSLNPRNSPFDKYMQGEEAAITEQQKRGFNLFMGKAQCGTCHFAPLFNGLTPPLYNLTEFEIAGTTKTDNFSRPQTDTDRGRYNIFPIEFYKKAFKTPTVRNVSVTAPYMHNGSLKTLESVVEFYNKGGGKGLGLKVQNQTLSSTPLKLTKTEMHDIVSFMNSLKDTFHINNYEK